MNDAVHGSQFDLLSLSQFQNQILLSYDGPTPPPGVFDRILSIPAVTSDVKTRTFVDMMSTFGDGDQGIGPFGCVDMVRKLQFGNIDSVFLNLLHPH